MTVSFTPIPDVTIILNHLLDIYERRAGAPKHVVRVRLNDLVEELTGYFNQDDSLPRTTANEQLEQLARCEWLRLTWQSGQTGQLLEAVVLQPIHAESIYDLLERPPLVDRRYNLRALLLGDRYRLVNWRLDAVQYYMNQLKADRLPNPFSLTDEAWNQDLLAALTALPDEASREEIPYRVFSTQVFKNSSRFEELKETIARLARRHQPAWRGLSLEETLRELGLVPHPGHIYLYGPWELVDAGGQVMPVAGFYPSIGLPAAMVAQMQQVRVAALRVVCVENLTAFYELIRHEGRGIAALCLQGNPSPTMRYLLSLLARELPEQVPLQLWADIDYEGLNILAHLRQQVSTRFTSYRMDTDTLDRYADQTQPLSPLDERHLTIMRRLPSMSDMLLLIDTMLIRGQKLEQEAVSLEEN